MSKVEELIQQIKTQLVGNTGRRVLLVEGPDDVNAFRIFLERQFSDWERSWLIKDAGNKMLVLKAVKQEPTWLGLVDRDEWTDDEIVEYTTVTPNLLILPRCCLESYLADPVELWDAFPPKQKAKIDGGFEQFRDDLTKELNTWLRHAALWHEVRPLWKRLRVLGFPDDVLDLSTVPDDVSLRAYLSNWQAALDVETVLQRVQALETRLSAEDVSVVCQRWIYAKSFYPQVVHQTLNRLLGQKDSKERRIAILRTRTVPDDLGFLWLAMGLKEQ